MSIRKNHAVVEYQVQICYNKQWIFVNDGILRENGGKRKARLPVHGISG